MDIFPDFKYLTLSRQGRFALERLSCDHLELVFPWQRGLSLFYQGVRIFAKFWHLPDVGFGDKVTFIHLLITNMYMFYIHINKMNEIKGKVNSRKGQDT